MAEKWNKLATFDPRRLAMIIPDESTRRFVVPTFPQSQIKVLTAAEAGYPAANRSLVKGSGANTWNWSLTKEFPLPRERSSVEFSAWIANVWNHPSFQEFSTNLSSGASVGRYTATKNYYIEPFSYGKRKISLRLRFRF